MKKLFLLAISVVLMCGCTPETTETEPSVNYPTKDDISGVWVLPNNNLYFISLGANGRYSFCFNGALMGAGTYELDKSDIILNNGYMYESDKLSLSIDGDTINLRGVIKTFRSGGTTRINYTFERSQEYVSPSMVGVVKERDPNLVGLSNGGKYSSKKFDVTYNTEYTATYVLRGKLSTTKQWVEIEREVWYYIFRTPYTYTQSPNGNGEVIIYEFDDKLAWSDKNKYLVEQK